MQVITLFCHSGEKPTTSPAKAISSCGQLDASEDNHCRPEAVTLNHFERKGSVMTDVIHYHTPDGPLYWSTDRVMDELGVSRPTAYRLMHASGAVSHAMRHVRVFAPDFIKYINDQGVRDE